MSNLVPFDETEAIILLSVCKFILVCNLSKNSMLDCLSKILKSSVIISQPIQTLFRIFLSAMKIVAGSCGFLQFISFRTAVVCAGCFLLC